MRGEDTCHVTWHEWRLTVCHQLIGLPVPWDKNRSCKELSNLLASATGNKYCIINRLSPHDKKIFFYEFSWTGIIKIYFLGEIQKICKCSWQRIKDINQIINLVGSKQDNLIMGYGNQSTPLRATPNPYTCRGLQPHIGYICQDPSRGGSIEIPFPSSFY